MKRLFYLMVAAALFLCLSSCSILRSSQSQVPDTSYWYGKSRNAIMMSFGIPDREASDGAGGVVLVYEDISTVTSKNSKKEKNFVTDEPVYESSETVSQVRRFAEFFLNMDDSCYNIRTNLRSWQFDNPEQRPWK